MLRLIGLTIKGIILLTLFIGGCQFITLSDETWTSISKWATMENLHIVIGGATVIFVVAVVCKIASFAGPVVGGVCKVVFFPITLPFKVLGMFSGGGGGSYSAPAEPKTHAWYVTMRAHDKKDKYFCSITSDGYIKTVRYMATDKNDAIQQATAEHGELLLTGRGRIIKTEINYFG